MRAPTSTRTFALLALLWLSLPAGFTFAIPTPEHRDRYQSETIIYQWQSVIVWRYDELTNSFLSEAVWILVQNHREGYKPMPKGGEIPKPPKEIQ